MRFRFATLILCLVSVNCANEGEETTLSNGRQGNTFRRNQESGSSRDQSGFGSTDKDLTNRQFNAQANRRPQSGNYNEGNVQEFGGDYRPNQNQRPISTNNEYSQIQGFGGQNYQPTSSTQTQGLGGQNYRPGGSTQTQGFGQETSLGNQPGSGQNTFSNQQGLRPSNSGNYRPSDQDNYRPQGFQENNQNLGGRPNAPSNNLGNLNNQNYQTTGRPNTQSSFTSGVQNVNQNFESSNRPLKENQGTDQYPGSIQEVSNKKNGTGGEEEEEKEVCFRHLGCFSMEKPWKSTLRPVKAPFSPEKIQTTLFFFSRQNAEKQRNITLHPQVNMGQAQFDPHKITAIIVHGFSNSGNAAWMKDMKNAYLKQVDANVLLVDWGKGAQVFSYLQVAGNTRVVGKQLALFVKYLIDNYGADPGKFHLIGHSLGAQICSYLAKDVPGIARLTALDPAQPGFEGFGKEVRLDPSDAEFVDVVHTDARPFLPFLGFGMIAPHGHVDFYMNGGFDQPGCVPPPKKELPKITSILDLAKYPVELIAKLVACPHARAYEFLTESFNETEKCIFWGHKADVSNVLKSVTNTITQGALKKFVALSSSCSKEDCTPLGFATKKSPLRGSFVVTTGGRSPYCISEPGVPPETAPRERSQSFFEKISQKVTGAQ